jgi:hypothetical protein
MSDSTDSKSQTGDVSNEEVADFLNSNGPDLKTGVELPSLTPASKPAAPAESAEKIQPDPSFGPQQPTPAKALDTLLNSGEVEFDAEAIRPTDAEKEIFLRSVLCDEPVQLTFCLPGMTGVDVTVKTRSNEEQALLFATLAEDQATKRIGNTMTYIAWLQYYDAVFRLVKFGPKHFPAGAETSEELRRKAQAFMPLSVVKWKVISAAIRLFDLKVNAAVNSVIARDFSTPAG